MKRYNSILITVLYLFVVFSSTNLSAFNPVYNNNTIPVIYTPNHNAVTSGKYVTNELSYSEKQSEMQYMSYVAVFQCHNSSRANSKI